MANTGEELTALIEAKGQEIRTLKTEGAAKDALKPHIDELLMLKGKFKTVTGTAYVAPGQEKKSKPVAPPAPPGAEAADPNKKSKKQLQREKKEAEKAIAKAKAKDEREKKQAEAAAQGSTQERCVCLCAHDHLGKFSTFHAVFWSFENLCPKGGTSIAIKGHSYVECSCYSYHKLYVVVRQSHL